MFGGNAGGGRGNWAMKIYLVRHTEYSNPENIYPFWLPVHLSKIGKEHAQLIGEWFAKKGEMGLPIYCSPLDRCKETAEIIAKNIGSKIELDKRLIETYCPGRQGKPIPKDKGWIYEETDPKRERRPEIRKRMMSIFNEKKKEGKDCILVSHGDPIVTMYYHFRHLRLPKYLWNPKNPNLIKKGGIVELEITPNNLVVSSYDLGGEAYGEL